MFRDFIPDQKLTIPLCLIRHDVDRRPRNALKMAILENKMGIKATYYFRHKPGVFKPDIIKAVEKLDHEVGYHYENLSDANGNLTLAIEDFKLKLQDFKKIVTVKTISMHGRPLKKFDNRDMWNDENNYSLLKNKFELIGEVYKDIDYTDIAYITDTGRNWHTSKNNIRDTTNSKINIDFRSGEELLNYFKYSPDKKIVFQVHPERWDENMLFWAFQLTNDIGINRAKRIVRWLK
ncbi:hypothetical protein BH10BAC5_BH10BAC5_11480 [soil metagenome]